MFLGYTILFLLGYTAFIWLLWSAMQYGEMFDIITRGKFTKFMSRHRKLGMIFGGCEKCTSFWWALPYTIVYFVFMKMSGDWTFTILPTWIFLTVFWNISALLGFFVLTFKKHPDV